MLQFDLDGTFVKEVFTSFRADSFKVLTEGGFLVFISERRQEIPFVS